MQEERLACRRVDTDFGFMDENDEPVEYPIDGILDLHHFSPKDVKELVPEYINACLERGIAQIRIIHGKGTGTLRRIVHSLLDQDERVLSYRLDSTSASSWGATLVELRVDDDERDG
jgi:DNA-nicking Smr family endonuclease